MIGRHANAYSILALTTITNNVNVNVVLVYRRSTLMKLFIKKSVSMYFLDAATFEEDFPFRYHFDVFHDYESM